MSRHCLVSNGNGHRRPSISRYAPPRGQAERVFVGGIAATLMFDEFIREPRWAGVRFIKGLLDQPAARSLHLSADDGDFGAHDIAGTPIEALVPDYKHPGAHSIRLSGKRRLFRVRLAWLRPQVLVLRRSETRGRSTRDAFYQWSHRRRGETFRSKKDLILMDNNVAASSRYQEVVAEIRDLGFERGAMFVRDGGPSVKRRVDFNQGVDARILAKTPMYLREMATICIDPLRIAFDHVGMRRVYERSVEMAADYGLRSLSNYMLYNFPLLDEYQTLLRRLTSAERAELIALLSDTVSARPRHEAYMRLVSDKSISQPFRELARFHAIDTKSAKVTDIAEVFPELTPDHMLPEPDVVVEDAGPSSKLWTSQRSIASPCGKSTRVWSDGLLSRCRRRTAASRLRRHV